MSSKCAIQGDHGTFIYLPLVSLIHTHHCDTQPTLAQPTMDCNLHKYKNISHIHTHTSHLNIPYEYTHAHTHTTYIHIPHTNRYTYHSTYIHHTYTPHTSHTHTCAQTYNTCTHTHTAHIHTPQSERAGSLRESSGWTCVCLLRPTKWRRQPKLQVPRCLSWSGLY